MKGENVIYTVLDEWTLAVTARDALVTEKRIRLLLQPKPRWLPEFAWRRLVARFILIEETRL